ncbi:hypothetical protein BG004_001510 [Podila humilis]|nr:hypothetical protein BG004_001510 [Podila humilis]
MTSGKGDAKKVVLAKSNATPASLDDLTWTIYASTPQKNIYELSGLAQIGSFSCHVDDQGVFTALSLNKKPPVDGAAGADPGGYQYNPATESWTNIDVAPDYKWSTVGSHTLFTLTDGSTKTLMHVYKTDKFKSETTIAVYDPTTKQMVERNTTWTLPSSSGSPLEYVGSGDNIYILSNEPSTKLNYLTIGRMTAGGTPPLASAQRTVLLNQTEGCSTNSAKIAIRENMYYLFCKVDGKSAYNLYSSDGNTEKVRDVGDRKPLLSKA